MDNEMMFKL